MWTPNNISFHSLYISSIGVNCYKSVFLLGIQKCQHKMFYFSYSSVLASSLQQRSTVELARIICLRKTKDDSRTFFSADCVQRQNIRENSTPFSNTLDRQIRIKTIHRKYIGTQLPLINWHKKLDEKTIFIYYNQILTLRCIVDFFSGFIGIALLIILLIQKKKSNATCQLNWLNTIVNKDVENDSMSSTVFVANFLLSLLHTLIVDSGRPSWTASSQRRGLDT